MIAHVRNARSCINNDEQVPDVLQDGEDVFFFGKPRRRPIRLGHVRAPGLVGAFGWWNMDKLKMIQRQLKMSQTMQKGLHARIVRLVEMYAPGSNSAFARKVNISPATLNRNLAPEKEHLLTDLTGWILIALPEVSPDWLLFGEGEMLRGNSASPSSAAHENARVAGLEKTVAALEGMIAAQKETIAAKDELLRVLHHEGKGTNALGMNNVVPLSRGDSEQA